MSSCPVSHAQELGRAALSEARDVSRELYRVQHCIESDAKQSKAETAAMAERFETRLKSIETKLVAVTALLEKVAALPEIKEATARAEAAVVEARAKALEEERREQRRLSDERSIMVLQDWRHGRWSAGLYYGG